jgi:hypothetical protein
MPLLGNAENGWGFYQPTGSIHTQLTTLRRKFLLRPDSPGKNAASDGLDMGIYERSGVPGRTAVPRQRPIEPQGFRIVQ